MIQPRGCLTDLEGLREWYYNQDGTYWTLFNGNDTRPTGVIHRNVKTETKDASWALLEKTIIDLSMYGGSYTILAKSNKNDNSGARVQLAYNPHSGHGSGIAGMQMQTENVDAKINQALHQYQLEREIQELRAALAEKQQGSMLDRLTERIANNPSLPQLIDLCIAKLVGGAQVSMAGFDPEYEAAQHEEQQNYNQQTKQTEEMEDTVQRPAGNGQKNFSNSDDVAGDFRERPTSDTAEVGFNQFSYDPERLGPALDKINIHFKDIYVFMDTLAEFIDTKPDLARSFFNSNK